MSKTYTKEELLVGMKEAINVVGEILEHGAEKYEPHGWKILPTSPTMGVLDNIHHMLNHINNLKKGILLDNDSGLHHASHVACRALMMVTRYLDEVSSPEDHLIQQDIIDIKLLLRTDESLEDIAEKFKVPLTTIQRLQKEIHT